MADLPTVVTVTWNTWDTYTSRLFEQFFYYVPSNAYSQWIVVDNDSDDADQIQVAMSAFPSEHRDKICLLRCDANIGDLPQYNRVIEGFVESERVVCISTDMRLFGDVVSGLSSALDECAIIGKGGPVVSRCEKGPWHWVPRLLLERGIHDFEVTAHVQTHCFAVKRRPFLEVGGFWEPPVPDTEFGGYLDKGNLITGEMMLSLKLIRAGYKIQPATFPAYHYGNGMKSRSEMDAFDAARNWDLSFLTEGSWHFQPYGR